MEKSQLLLRLFEEQIERPLVFFTSSRQIDHMKLLAAVL